MKLLFVFTGGTIGSAVSGDYITTDDNMPYELLEAYRKKYGFEHSYNVLMPYTELSEQNTGETISKLVKCVCEAVGMCNDDSSIDNEEDVMDLNGVDSCKNDDANIDDSNEGAISRTDPSAKYDGIIVTHGTDTLPYSAAALSYALGNNTIPVVLVSSNYPIADERANGVDNLHGAIKLIADAMLQYETGTTIGKKKHRGVFVSYKNHDGIIYIHRASRLLETAAFSDEYFSAKGLYYGKIAGDCFDGNPDYSEKADGMKPFGTVRLANVCNCIHRYHLFPGIEFENMGGVTNQVSNLDTTSQTFSGRTDSDGDDITSQFILLEGYHSGTINTKLNEYREYYRKMYELGIPVFLCGVVDRVSYESTSLYDELHIQPVYYIAPVAAYMKMWMLACAGRDVSAKTLMFPLGGDL